MRKGFGSLLLMSSVFSGGYFFYVAQAVCPIPITYRIGELHPNFGLSESDAREAVLDAERVWEEAVGRDLFIYDETADFTVNFVYDERHALTQAEALERAKLDADAKVHIDVAAQYTELVATYDALQLSYEARSRVYEKQLASYNTTVASYNEAGGAPDAAFLVLQTQEQALEEERIALEDTQQKLAAMVDEINKIGDRGNQLVERYNNGVVSYNSMFGTAREFTEGTYHSSGQIDIYTFANRAELKLVLAHELGHALSIDHVTGTQSVMYFLIGEQPTDLALSESDKAAFIAVCGEGSRWDTIKKKFNQIF